jgi:hypothetical protein
MKTKWTTTIIAALTLSLVNAEEKHEHEKEHAKGEKHAEGHEKHEEHEEHDDHGAKGPNGGHVQDTKQGLIVEVVVNADRKAVIYRLDEKMKAVPLGELTSTGIAGERSAPTKMEFTKQAGSEALISSVPLPKGEHVAMILQLKPTADSKTITTRFELHLH